MCGAVRCYGMVPDQLYDYCFHELLCTHTQCAGISSVAVAAAKVSVAVLVAAAFTALWLVGAGTGTEPQQ